MNEIILKEEKGQVVASSNDIAEKFGKRHDQVLRDIDNMLKQTKPCNLILFYIAIRTQGIKNIGVMF